MEVAFDGLFPVPVVFVGIYSEYFSFDPVEDASVGFEWFVDHIVKLVWVTIKSFPWAGTLGDVWGVFI